MYGKLWVEPLQLDLLVKSPLISVIMPVYNAETYLAEAIESILNQEFTDFEFLILNDGSADRSIDIIRSYDDPRIIVCNSDVNKGLIFQLNRGIKTSRGKYIARMDADDISLPARLKTQIDFLENNPQYGLCGTWFKAIGNLNTIFETPRAFAEIKLALYFYNPFCHPTIVIKRELLVENNILYRDLLHAEDYLLYIDLLDKCKMANIPEVLFIYRWENSNISVVHAGKQRDNAGLARLEYLQKKLNSYHDKSLLRVASFSLANINFNISRNTFKDVNGIFYEILELIKASASLEKKRYIAILYNRYLSYLSANRRFGRQTMYYLLSTNMLKFGILIHFEILKRIFSKKVGNLDQLRISNQKTTDQPVNVIKY